MTTPATQSSNALGRRSLPSSFFSPLQTLGRYIDRQRGDGADASGGSPDDGPDGGQLRDHGAASGQPSGGLAGPEFRLGEVGQYEAGQYEDGEDADGPDEDGRYDASWRQWSAAADAVSSPDPEAVRGAISRLARGAQWPQLQSQPHPGLNGPGGSVSPEAAGFAEVARRVWSEAAAGSVVPHPGQRPAAYESAVQGESPVEQSPVEQSAVRQSPVQQNAVQQSPVQQNADPTAIDLAATGTRNTDGAQPDLESSPEFAPPDQAGHTSDVLTSDLRPAGQAAERPQGLGRRIGPVQDTGPETSPDTVAAARPGSAEAHALAHDAGNLLSALHLYSELLCFSGVLDERHRHYAEDLKLLSQRSGRLIDRLLHLAQQVAAAEQTTVAAADTSLPAAVPSKMGPEAAPTDALLGAAPFPAAPVPEAPPREPASISASGRTAPERLGPELVETAGRDDQGGSLETAGTVGTNQDPAVLAEVVMRLRGVLGTIAHGALAVELGPMAGVPVTVPVEALERVLVNLVSNAAAAVRDGGAVRIRAGVPGVPAGAEGGGAVGAGTSGNSTVVLTVDDSGCGMSEAQLRSALGLPSERPAEYRAGVGPSPQPASGLSADGLSANAPTALAPAGRRRGLGLSIVRELVRLHGGKLFIHSRPGTGTRIEIHWPAAACDLTETRSGPVLSPVLWHVPVRRSAVLSHGGAAQAALRLSGSAPAAPVAVQAAEQAAERAAVQAAVQGAVA